MDIENNNNKEVSLFIKVPISLNFAIKRIAATRGEKLSRKVPTRELVLEAIQKFVQEEN
jgi:hypothetical protein